MSGNMDRNPEIRVETAKKIGRNKFSRLRRN